MTLAQHLGTPCYCTTIRLPLGAYAVWADGTLHHRTQCTETDNLDGFDVEVPR